jgi:hypothetical protein
VARVIRDGLPGTDWADDSSAEAIVCWLLSPRYMTKYEDN